MRVTFTLPAPRGTVLKSGGALWSAASPDCALYEKTPADGKRAFCCL